MNFKLECVSDWIFIMTSDNEEIVPPATTAPSTTSAGTAPPVTVPGIVSAAAPPGTTSQLVVPPQQQAMISGLPGASGSGGSTTVNSSSIVSPVATFTDTTALANVLSSGVIAPQQLAELQNKLAALSMGGLSMPITPINVTPLPIFQTQPVSGSLELSSLMQALPQGTGQTVNQNALLNVVKVLANESRELMVARREAEIDKQVKLLSNPMSKRSVDHDLRLLDCVKNVKRVLMVNGGVLVATSANLDVVNRSLGLVLSAIQEVEDRCVADKAKHLVAHKSHYGWKFVSSLESLEKKVGGIEISTLRAQEKAYATHLCAVGGDSKWADNDWLESSSSSSTTVRGKNFLKNQNRKANLKAKKQGGGGAKQKEHQVNRSGKVQKPPKKGCYRCGQPHRVEKCPLPLATPAE